jgi:hypothetical protein
MTLRVFASGQSNMLGQGSGGPPWSGLSANVTVWNNVNNSLVNGGAGTAFVTPSTARSGGTFDGSTSENNLAVWFCDSLARHSHEPVTLTMVARGGTPIEEWAASGSTYPMLAACLAAWTATGQAPADVFLWHQGEHNSALDPAEYRAKFLTLLDDLTAGGVIDANTLVIVGGLMPNNTTRVAFNARTLGTLARTGRVAVASSYGLTDFDGIHFDGKSLHKLGARRYFAAYLFAKRTA